MTGKYPHPLQPGHGGSRQPFVAARTGRPRRRRARYWRRLVAQLRSWRPIAFGGRTGEESLRQPGSRESMADPWYVLIIPSVPDKGSLIEVAARLAKQTKEFTIILGSSDLRVVEAAASLAARDKLSIVAVHLPDAGDGSVSSLLLDRLRQEELRRGRKPTEVSAVRVSQLLVKPGPRVTADAP